MNDEKLREQMRAGAPIPGWIVRCSTPGARTIADGEWHHVVVTSDNTNDLNEALRWIRSALRGAGDVEVTSIDLRDIRG